MFYNFFLKLSLSFHHLNYLMMINQTIMKQLVITFKLKSYKSNNKKRKKNYLIN